MTPLHKSAAFIQGVRQELLANGFSEADALVLSKRANYEKLASEYPDEFSEGYFNRLQIENAKKKKDSSWLTWDNIISALPYIAGAGALYAIFGTNWGKRRREEMTHTKADAVEKSERYKHEPIRFNNESGKKDNSEP